MGDGDDSTDDDGDVCGVDWENTLSYTQDEDDAIYNIGKEAGPGGKWTHISAVVDSGAAENVLPADVCTHVQLTPTDRSKAGIGFRGAGGDRIRNHGQREFRVRMHDGMCAKSTWQVADVKRPLMSVGKMIAAGNQVHLDAKNPRVVRPKGGVVPLRKAGNVFLIDLWVKADAQSGFARQG